MPRVEPVLIGALEGKDLFPLAALSTTADHLANSGVSFVEGEDDLDTFVIAAMKLLRDTPFERKPSWWARPSPLAQVTEGFPTGSILRRASMPPSTESLPFALRRYRAAPPNTFDVLLPMRWAHAPIAPELVRDIAVGLSLDEAAIVWPSPPVAHRDAPPTEPA